MFFIGEDNAFAGIEAPIGMSVADRLDLTEHNDMPSAVYVRLAMDESADVRYSLASNANIPKFVLIRLVEDDNVYVSCRAMKTLARLEKEEYGDSGGQGAAVAYRVNNPMSVAI